MGLDLGTLLYQISVWLIPSILAITLHEAAHGWVAWKLGDDTAKQMGRVSFNPFVHIDRFGTLVLPGLLLLMSEHFLFGYAKPVPVNVNRLEQPKRDMIWVAAAGPGMNLLMAFIAALLFHTVTLFPDSVDFWLAHNLNNALLLNIVLALFNMLPIPPLDGGRVLTGLLPLPLARQFAQIERYGMLIIIGLIALPPLIGQQIGANLNVLGWILTGPLLYVRDVILMMAGLGS
tara:strand:+ start:311 stop:1006 length:696 start_codon:yes stop_codon:yes gene_type:complete